MGSESSVLAKQIDAFCEKLRKEAENAGYHLNPDVDFTKELVRGLLENKNALGTGPAPAD